MRSFMLILLLAGLAARAAAESAPVVAIPAPARDAELTLESAMSMAAEQHPEIAVRAASVAEARAQHASAAGRMRPQVSGAARVSQIDDDRSGAEGLGAPERDTRVGLSLSQTIYDASLRANVKVSDRSVRQTEQEARLARLDAMHDAGVRFLQSLLATALRDIAADNLKLTTEHLALARNRHKLGAAGLDEVLRFEAEEARQRTHLISAEADIDKARVALNLALGADAAARWSPRPVELEEGGIRFLDDAKLGRFLAGGETRVAQFREFSVVKALEAAPELGALDEAIAAQQIVLEQQRRVAYVPQVGFSVSFDRIVSQQYALDAPAPDLMGPGFPISRPDDNEWQAGLVASLPLYEGGSRRHEIAAAAARLAFLEQTRAKSARDIGARTRTAVYDLHAAFRQIDLARTAADRARRSQEIVNNKYTRGAAQIIEVLDAQNEALVEQIGAANALNRHLQAVIGYQRAIAWFDHFVDAGARAAWVGHFNRFIAQDAGTRP